MPRSTENHDFQGNKSARRVDEARRHFIGLTAAVAARAAALGTLTAMVLPSSANAKDDNSQGEDSDGGGHGKGRGPNCFLRGTSILTSSGPVRVEDLKVGDPIETVDGKTLPALWIGRQSYRRSGSSWPEEVVPIHVGRGALAEQTPHSDLYLSPNHALFIDGVLIPVKHLVNGTSVAPVNPDHLEVIEYFHLVLATHQIVLAEGAPAETLRVWDRNHENFTNFVEYERLYPDRIGSKMRPYARLAGCEGGRAHLKALLSLAACPFVLVRDPIEEAHRKLAKRAEELAC
ncbi:Hint domain-containing protein [Mesorhizobium sp. KR1-2]|uniref:Hint domain-containing protein n=1 Tax=Mesorhizobium sp. KR1-2 TaxID=3156609 RepID=UPI0032B590AF